MSTQVEKKAKIMRVEYYFDGSFKSIKETTRTEPCFDGSYTPTERGGFAMFWLDTTPVIKIIKAGLDLAKDLNKEELTSLDHKINEAEAGE